jgi:TonB family protein
MKPILLPLLALPMLLGSCNHIIVTQVPQTPSPVQLANRDTAWGEMPTYDPKDQFFVIGTPSRFRNFPTDGTVTIDLLVNRDGTVRAVKVSESSGDMKADRAAIDLYRNARYTLKLAGSDPAPYVVTQKVVLKMVAQSSEEVRNSTDYGRDYNYGPTYTEGNQTGTSNNVNGFLR